MAPTSEGESAVISVERVIAAPHERIFELLADPAQHVSFDGSDSVRSSVSTNPTRLALGAKFKMGMRRGISYPITNEVVEFEEGRRIGWQHGGHNVWRYELEPVAGGTRVRESFDASNGRGTWVLRAMNVFERNRNAMEATLERIAWLTEQT